MGNKLLIMECPHCGSSNCKSLKMINLEGTRSASSAEFGTTTSETDLAKQCKPPTNYFMVLGYIVSAVAGLTIGPGSCIVRAVKGMAFSSNMLWTLITTIAVIFICVVIFTYISRLLGFTRRYDNAYDRWEVTFMCESCGTRFEFKK